MLVLLKRWEVTPKLDQNLSFGNSEFPKFLIFDSINLPKVSIYPETKCSVFKHLTHENFYKQISNLQVILTRVTLVLVFIIKFTTILWNMKVSSFSHQSTYFHYRCKELQLFTYLVFYLNEKTCPKVAAHLTENFPWQENIFKITKFFLSLSSESLKNIHLRSLVFIQKQPFRGAP